MKRPPLLFAALCALLAPAVPARAETLDPLAFSRTLSFTVSGYDGESTLENFPVLVRLSERIDGFSYADIGLTTNAAYASLRFTDAGHESLDYEIEEWHPGGTSFVWVSLPELSGTNTEFRAFYSPDAGAVLPDVHPTNVWTSAGYVGVWHLNSFIKTVDQNYVEYNNPLWGQYWPDSTGRGANATKGTIGNTTWKPSLYCFPEDPSRNQYSSYGRANGTLGANAYTPFIIPPTSEGGGAGDWSFSGTGYSTEAWIFPFGKDHAFFIAGQTTDGSSDNFTRASTNLVRIAANDWGQISSGWNDNETSERIWHFVTTVWTPASSADPTRLYGTSGDEAPTILQERNCHATDQFATEGMRFTAGTGQDHGVDEMRVRRGLSTSDWIQANWDAQRVGTDFLEYGVVRKPRDPAVTAISATAATVSCDYSFAGGEYAGSTVRALFVAFPSNATNAFAVANPARPSVRATGLSPDTDYSVRFVVERGGTVLFETTSVDFVTAGRPTIRPNHYRRTVTFTATGYDGEETLEHFPVLVHLSTNAVPGFSYEYADPATIRFSTPDGALLAHEIEGWDTNGLSAIWVCLPSLAGTNTAFTMHWRPYDGAGVPAQPVYRVWHYAGYLGVWHMNDTVQGVFGRQFDDSSGHGMITTNYYASNNIRPPLVVTNAAESANGTAWFRNRNAYWGDERGDYLKYGVAPEQTADWNFSETGYSVETWARPAFLNASDHGGMFCTSLNPDNLNNWNALNALCVRNDRAGFECDWKTYIKSGAWTDDETNDWHYVAGVWAAAGSGDASICYEARADLPAGELRTLVSRTDVAACDFVGRNMGLIGGNPPPRGSGYQSYQVDEMRVRRGRSSADWIQANWDTQRVGTDFLAAGPVLDNIPPTILLLR